MGGFAEALRALMAERGVSGNALARKVPCDSALISRYRCGKQKPSVRMARAIDDALDAQGALVALASPAPGRRAVLAGIAAVVAGPSLFGTLDVDERERLAWAARRAPRIDVAAVASLAGVLASQRCAEDALGAATVLGPVMAQLAVVEELVSSARGPVRPAVVDIAQQWTQFAAWLHRQCRDFPASQVLWRQTLELAAEADDATMTATVLTRRAEMAWLAGEIGSMIGLAQAAQRDERAATSERAHSAGVEARGLAITGDAATAERKLGQAADLASQFADRPGEQRPWSYWYTPQWFQCERGVTLGYLSAHSDQHRALAVEELTAGYEGFSADVARAEWALDYILRRAAIHARGGDVEQACADALEVVPISLQTNSASLRGMLTELHAGLAARYPNDARVRELADALA
jgi:transcriptional regulator with XRE-family HTH domain